MSILKTKRENSGYTQIELAKKTKLSLRTIQRLESSNVEPKGHTLTVLSEAFNINPSDLLEQFKIVEQTKKSETTFIRIINLSVLSCLIIPFGNIILPLILWRKNRKSKFVDEIVKRIINVQIIWCISLSFFLSISPLISRLLFSNRSIILIVLFLVYATNVFIVYVTAIKLQQNNFRILNIPVRFI